MDDVTPEPPTNKGRDQDLMSSNVVTPLMNSGKKDS